MHSKCSCILSTCTGVYHGGDDGPYPSSLRPNIDLPSFLPPSMVAHGVRTMKRSHLPPRPANTLPDPHRKSGVWADVAPQCEPSCQTASILQTRSNPSRSTFPPSSWTPPPLLPLLIPLLPIFIPPSLSFPSFFLPPPLPLRSLA